MNHKNVQQTENELRSVLEELAGIHGKVREAIKHYVEGFALKGNETVGWLGEMYVAQLLGGTIKDDSYSYDIKAVNKRGKKMRVEVKTRRKVTGKKGWRRTGIITLKDGEKPPTHLAFVKLAEDYSLSGIYLYPWDEIDKERLKLFKVKGQQRGYYFRVRDDDDKYLKHPVSTVKNTWVKNSHLLNISP